MLSEETPAPGITIILPFACLMSSAMIAAPLMAEDSPPEVSTLSQFSSIRSSRPFLRSLHMSNALCKVTGIGAARAISSAHLSLSILPSAFKIPITTPSQFSALQAAISVFIRSNSKSEYRKSPPLGRTIGYTFIVNNCLAMAIWA
ncbi:hypothetical protein D3C87_1399920 [compost metagenome]